MKITTENLEFYLSTVNSMQPTELYLSRANGTNYINSKKGNETFFSGTLSDCYYFLLGISRLRIESDSENRYIVNSNLRVYLVVDSLCRNYFCNINNLNKVVKENSLKPGYFTIYHFWNNKQQKVSKKELTSFFEGSQLKQDFIY